MLKLAALAVCAALLAVMLRKEKREFALLLELGCCVVILAAALNAGRQIIAGLRGFADQGALAGTDAAVLLKGAGICIVTEICAALCRESGNAAVGEVLVFAGRCMTVLLALPLMERAVRLVLVYCG